MDTLSLNVPSISCSVCAGKIQNGVSEVKGVNKVSVDLKSQNVNVEYDPQVVQGQEIKNKISSLGFEVFQ